MKALRKKVIVEVTEADIDGAWRSCVDNPVWNAVKRRLEPEYGHHVTPHIVTILSPWEVVFYQLPPAATNALGFWFDDEVMEPFQFLMTRVK